MAADWKMSIPPLWVNHFELQSPVFKEYLTIFRSGLLQHAYINLGSDGINKANAERGGNIKAMAGSFVHSSCPRRFVDKKDIEISKRKSTEDSLQTTSRKSIRLSTEQFECLFCCKSIDLDCADEISKVETHGVKSIVETMKSMCNKRGDEWSFKVKGIRCFFTIDNVV